MCMASGATMPAATPGYRPAIASPSSGLGMRSRPFSTRSWCWRRTERGAGSVRFLGQPGQRHDLDALLNQGTSLVGRGGTADGALLDLSIVDLARLLREAAAHVLRIRFEHLPHRAHQVAVSRRGLFLGDRHVTTRA